MTTETDAVLNLIAEAGILKSIRRSGWWMIGMKHAESVADHSFRTALIGYLLAKREDVDPYPVVMMSLLNDLHESRINDLHKVGQRYIDFCAAERQVAQEQAASMPADIGDDLRQWMQELQAQSTPASIVARDADLLECMIQGKEYVDQGHPQAIAFATQPAHLLQTTTAKALAAQLPTWNSDEWWQELVTLAR